VADPRPGVSAPSASATADPDPDFLREHFCINPPVPGAPTEKPLSSRERAAVTFALWNARSVASRAYMNLGRRDPHHLRIAKTAFGGPVTVQVLDANVGRIKGVLDRLSIDHDLRAGTCDHPACNDGHRNAVAVTLDDLSAVILCPFFFTQHARTLVTTLLHEAGHMVPIDVHFTPGSETYCRRDDTIECDDVCPLRGENLLENVDAWMRFMYCVSVSG
jgi:hypothetical protein